MLLLLCGSLAVSINTAIGLAMACDGFKDCGSCDNVNAVGR